MARTSPTVVDLATLGAESQRARQALALQLAPTPLVSAPELAIEGVEPRLKLECEQPTGSFKIRGATWRLLQMTPAERARGVIAASTGNHALAVAHAASRFHIPATLFVPASTVAAKRRKLNDTSASIQLVDGGCVDAELAARKAARASGKIYVSPYNDPDVIAGQGSLGIELREQWPEVDVVLITVGGGGLISGTAAALEVTRGQRPTPIVIGCSPSANAVMAESVSRGELVSHPDEETLSDGSAGGLEPGTMTLPLCARSVDAWVRLPEHEISHAMVEHLRTRRRAIEGAAATAIAGWRRMAKHLQGRHVAIVVCGGNVSLATLKGVFASLGA